MNSDNYLFGERDGISEHADLINLIHNVHSRKFINETLKSPKGRILEVACGQGAMTRWFAQHPEVTDVLGIDIDAAAIAHATQCSAAEKLPNVTFKIHSVYDLDLIEGEFDLIYLRFILIHLTSPSAALRSIYHKLKPGGMMICETAIHSHCFSDPKVQSYDQFMKYIMQLFASQGKDCDLGKQIFSLIGSQKFTVEKMNFIQLLLQTIQEKKMVFLAMQNARSRLIQNKLITEKELDELEARMAIDYLDTNSIWGAPTLCQIAARK